MMRNVKKANPPIETQISDLQVASYLLALGYPTLRTEGASHRIEFIFANVPEDIVFRFFQDDSKVNPRKLLDAYRNLKGLIVQRERGRR